jgi:hypothetical protein
MEAGDKRGGPQGTWAKVKYDRQIVAIARGEGADITYSDNNDVRKLATQAGIAVRRIAELPLPPEMAQGRWDFQGQEGPQEIG